MMIQVNRYFFITLFVVIAGFSAYNLGILGFLLSCSIIANIFLLVKMLKMQDFHEKLEEDITNLYFAVDAFGEHLDRISEMHVYHMDDNIMGMLKHTKMVINSLIDFQEEYGITPGVEEEDDGNDEEEKTS